MEEEIASIERIKDAAAKLAEVPKIENPTEEQVIANERVIRAAKTAYDKLSSEERKSLKIADVKNYQGFAKILVKMDLAAAKSVALKKLERYNPSDYRTAERDILIAIIAEASSAIKAKNRYGDNGNGACVCFCHCNSAVRQAVELPGGMQR